MADQPDVTFCLMVPAGTWALSPLVEAIHLHHPGAAVVAVWCGDPHLRPVLEPGGGVTWADLALPDIGGIGWGLRLAGLRRRAYEWCRAASVVRALLADGSSNVIVFRVGSVAMLGECSALARHDGVTMVRRSVPTDDDGCSPDASDLVREGTFSPAVAGFGAGSGEALDWLVDQMPRADDNLGPWFDVMSRSFEVVSCVDPLIGVGPWTSPAPAMPRLLDLEHFAAERPWTFDLGERPPRVRQSNDPVLAAAISAALSQVGGHELAVSIPGGIPVDAAVHSTVRDAVWPTSGAPAAHAQPPDPWGLDGGGFRAWLEGRSVGAGRLGRYWSSLVRVRPDLAATFPRFETRDAKRYRRWARTSWRDDNTSVLIEPPPSMDADVISAGTDRRGINLVGYLGFDQSLGHVARLIGQALEAAQIPFAPIDYARSVASRRVADGFANVAEYGTNIVVVTADQFEFVVADHGATLLDGRRTIAYWFWELEDVPETFQAAIDHVDEIWTGSQFIADSFARVTDKPVRCVPLPIARPQPSARRRSTMGIPDDAYVLLTTFDQFSVPERKNPFGVIDAFTSAFTEGEGPVLLVKTMNGSKGWRNHERLLLAAAGRSDIVVWDEHLSRPDQMAVLAAADCLVSLHRSEGLGLHCAEAMWLGKPVIATRYSGNLDFMDDTVAAMIDYELVPVRHGEGIYPETAHWADPDLDQAADWMRRLVADPVLGQQLGTLARERMEHQPSMADTGRRIAELAGLQRDQQLGSAELAGLQRDQQHDEHGGR